LDFHLGRSIHDNFNRTFSLAAIAAPGYIGAAFERLRGGGQRRQPGNTQ
jgi:hypothetical protein